MGLIISHLNKVLQLKIGSMMLFWFGVFAELVILSGLWLRHYQGIELFFIIPNDTLTNIWNISYEYFGHFIHIIAAYLISKGKKIGVILALAISSYEILGFLVPVVHPSVFTVQGFGIRILFALVIILIIFGRKELSKLQTQNWRPWKNPKKSI